MSEVYSFLKIPSNLICNVQAGIWQCQLSGQPRPAGSGGKKWCHVSSPRHDTSRTITTLTTPSHMQLRSDRHILSVWITTSIYQFITPYNWPQSFSSICLPSVNLSRSNASFSDKSCTSLWLQYWHLKAISHTRLQFKWPARNGLQSTQ